METIENKVVLDALDQVYHEMWQFCIDRLPTTNRNKLIQDVRPIMTAFIQKLVDVGFLQNVCPSSTFDGTLSPFMDKLYEMKAGSLTATDCVNWCTSSKSDMTEGRGISIDLFVREQQRQFGLPIVGYVRSERLTKGREALTRYHEAHQQLYLSPVEDMAAGHIRIWSEFQSEILALGFESVDEFHHINRSLPY